MITKKTVQHKCKTSPDIKSGEFTQRLKQMKMISALKTKALKDYGRKMISALKTKALNNYGRNLIS